VVTVGSLGTRLQGTASQAVGLGEVEQEGGTVTPDDPRTGDQQGGNPLGVAHESGEAAGGDDGKHRSGAGGGGGLSPSLERILHHLEPLSRVGSQNRDDILTGTRSGFRCLARARMEVDPMIPPYGLAGWVSNIGVCRATPLLSRFPES